MTKSIQQILDEQRQSSKIKDLSIHQITAITHNSGRIVSDETKKKISQGNKSDRAYQRKLETHLGKKRSEETCAKMSEHAKNRSEEHRAKLADSNRGKKASDETRAKMRESAKHKPPKSAESIQKTADALRGVPKSPEHIEALRIAQNKIRQTKEWKDAVIESRRKPCVTDLGVFYSLDKAGEAHGKSRVWVREKINKNSPGFYYISKEEYIMLTGTDK